MFDSRNQKIIISIILGFGLATLFRRVCKEKNCIIFKGPKLDDINGATFKYREKCYNYIPFSSKC